LLKLLAAILSCSYKLDLFICGIINARIDRRRRLRRALEAHLWRASGTCWREEVEAALSF